MPQNEKGLQTVSLGRTGLSVRKLGFGGIPIQTVSEEQAVETVRHAVERGIDFIDTSRLYTTSEKRIGLALKQTDKPVVVATKSFERTADKIRADVDLSLKTLQRDYIDLYQCHFVGQDDYKAVISRGGALEGLQRARAEGLIGHIGISSHDLHVLARVVENALFDTIMVCYSFMEPAAKTTVIPKAIEKNIGIIAMKPLSGGVIAAPQTALKWSLLEQKILVLCGMESKALVDENWAVFSGSHQLDDEDQRIIEKNRKEHDRSFCRRCDYCQPCTEGINIQMLLGIRSQVKRMGASILASEGRLDMFEKARNCSECEECLPRCPYSLPLFAAHTAAH